MLEKQARGEWRCKRRRLL